MSIYYKYLKKHFDNVPEIEIESITGRKKKSLPEFITEEEVYQIENVMDKERDKLMILFCFYCGLRAQGLINIKPCDFIWHKWNEDKTKPAKLSVIEKGKKQRIVFVPPLLMERFIKWIEKERMNNGTENPVWKIKYSSWRDIIRENGKKALNKEVHSHMLRHGCATWLLDNGWQLQEIADYLGHESIATTQIYAHLDKKKMLLKYGQLVSSGGNEELSENINGEMSIGEGTPPV
jgi:integrase/recombinase XerD